MASVNKAIILGNVGKDPEIRVSQYGKKMAMFSMATHEKWKDKESGALKEQVEWHKIIVYNEKVAGFVENHVKKGMTVYVEGKICSKKWLDKNGTEHIATEIVLSNFNGTLLIASAGSNNKHVGGNDYVQQTTTPSVTGYDEIDCPFDF